jgi:hypothetical protein
MTTLKPALRFALGGLVFGGLFNLAATGVALGDDAGQSPASRAPSSLTSLSSPGLQSAIQYSSSPSHNPSINDMSWTAPLPDGSKVQAAAQRSGLDRRSIAPVEPNSFPPMIAKIRTENWDE